MRLGWPLLAVALLAPVADAASFTVHAGTDPDGSLYFRPATLKAAKGDLVEITLVNDDQDQPHDWALLSYGGRDIEAYTGPGATATVKFHADDVGAFRIVCQVVGHKQRGMEGSFVVEKKLLPDLAPLVAAGAVVAVALLRRR